MTLCFLTSGGAASAAVMRESAFQLIDPGIGTIQAVHDGGHIYVLKSSGAIWKREGEVWTRIAQDAEARMIAAGGGALYMLRFNGNILQLQDGAFQVIDPAEGTRQIAADPQGSLFVLKEKGDVWKFSHEGFQRIHRGGGSRQITVADHVYLLKDEGRIHQWTGDDWKLVDNGTGTLQIVADQDVLYVLKESGHIWRRAGETWARISSSTGILQISASAGYLCALKRSGEIWRYSSDTWESLGIRPSASQIVAFEANCLLLMKNGNLLVRHAEPARNHPLQELAEAQKALAASPAPRGKIRVMARTDTTPR